LCVLSGRGAVLNGSIEPAEHLLESVIVAFAMATRQVGVRSRFFGQKRRILQNHLIGAVALAQPQLIWFFLVPRAGSLGSVYFDRQPILAPRGNLTDGERAASALAQTQHDRAKVLGVDGHYVVIRGIQSLTGESFDRAFRTFARFMKGLQIGAQRRDPQTGDMLDHVAPVCANVAERTRTSVGFGVNAPIPVRVIEQPVLRVGALHDQNLP
jgi:hypothetical protein